MSNSRYKKFAVLYVDDEGKSLANFERAFEDDFTIYTAATAQAGWDLLQQHKDEIGVLMTDQRMPGENGVWLLEKARELRPRMVRILATAYTDMDAAIAAVNSGSIYNFISKPWNPEQVETTLKRALDYFMVQRERDQLLAEKMSVLHNRLIAEHVVRLGMLAAGMSHHVRNSLVSVKTFLDLALDKAQGEKGSKDFNDREFWTDYRQEALNQLERIDGMLKDLWVASEKPASEFSNRVNLRELVGEIIERASSKLAAKSLVVTNDIPETLPELVVDSHKFSRLFELLLRDEIVSLPLGSEINFTAESDGATVEVRIVDNGPALPNGDARLVFDPFTLRSDTPTEFGINLMTCFFIVHHHGGTIEAMNQGEGTTFVLRLPLQPTRAPQTDENTAFLHKVLSNEAAWDKLNESERLS